MSKYAEFQTEIKDEKHLVAALKALGCTVEVHQSPQTLIGFEGTAEGRRATVIVRRCDGVEVCGLGDLGFSRDASGRFRMIADDYHPTILSSWTGKLKQEYQVSRQKAIAKDRGHIFLGREEIKTASGTRVQLRFGVR